jgi:TolB protein
LKRIAIFLLSFFVSFGAYSQKELEVISIELEKESYLTPVYIENTHSEQTTLTQNYLNEIEKILHFDFDHNGRTRVISQQEIGDGSYKKHRQAQEWRLFGVEYVFKLNLTGNYLTLSTLATLEDRVCFAEEIKLSGELAQDRVKIHECAQNLHQKLFNEKGIYLSQLLYTLKTKQSLNPDFPWVSEIYRCDWDGGNSEQMTHENSYCVTPTYLGKVSKHSKESYFFVSYKIGPPKIFWCALNDKEPKRLTYLRGNQLMPAISPKGDQVAFINDAPGNPELFIQDFKVGVGAIGKPKQIFSYKKGAQASPTYSPDGKHIAFVSNKDGCPRIYTIMVPDILASGKMNKPKLITKLNRENTKPSWSPDGTKLAYIGRVDGVRQVWIYDFVTEKEWQLTFGPGNKENPVWAFNSLHLIFNSVGNDSCELYMVNLNQPKAIRLKMTGGLKRFPVWIDKY